MKNMNDKESFELTQLIENTLIGLESLAVGSFKYDTKKHIIKIRDRHNNSQVYTLTIEKV